MLTLSVLLHLALLLPPALRPIANKPRCSAVRLIAPLPERQKSAYGAEQITVLEGLEPVRKRPGMYIGSTGPQHMPKLAAKLLKTALFSDGSTLANPLLKPVTANGPPPTHSRPRSRCSAIVSATRTTATASAVALNAPAVSGHPAAAKHAFRPLVD